MNLDDGAAVHVLTWEQFVDRLEALAPGPTFQPSLRVEEIPPYQRIRILRWISDYFEQPVPLAQLDQFVTIGELHRWMTNVLAAGERPRTNVHAKRGETTRVRLRPILERDIMPLYLASFDPDNNGRWRYRGRTLPLDEFVGTLYAGVLTQYMVDMVDTGQTIGLVTAYDENRSGLNCKLAYLRCGERAHNDQAALFEGMMLFISFLFDNFPFRKLYAEVPAYNASLFTGDFATVEGTLIDYLFHDGAFVDLSLVSIEREQWMMLENAAGTGRRPVESGSNGERAHPRPSEA